MRRAPTWNFFHDINDMQNDIMNTVMEQMAENIFRRQGTHHRSMDVDLSEYEHGYTLRAVLPGVNPENLNVDFADGVLTIKAETQAPEDAEGVRYHLRERSYGTYERSFRFPSPIKAEAIAASYQNGILTLQLPKEQVARSHRVRVQTSEA